MYGKYGRLQTKQLLEQDYLYTQDIRLLVYAAGRKKLLQRSLAGQLHRNFALLSEVPEAETGADGVLICAEDGELISTALMLLADRLREGFDFVSADAVYGPDGNLECYSPANGSPRHGDCRMALVSADLWKRILPLALHPADPAELLRLAQAQACRETHVPQALIHFKREILAGDVFSAEDKRALVLTHEFSMTGAPIVLVNAIPVLAACGYQVVVAGPKADGCLPLFREAGATVISHPEGIAASSILGLAQNCDFVLANTIVAVDAVAVLNGGPVPVLWWLHDAYLGYGFLVGRIPADLRENVHVCAVGKHAASAMQQVQPRLPIDMLLYGLPDYRREHFSEYKMDFAAGKLLFATVGTLESRKGQDILLEAIRQLPEEKRKAAVFLFVGKSSSPAILKQLRQSMQQYPEQVFYVERLSRDEIKSLMQQCDCLICSSRDDPMPTFVTEGLIFSKPAIVSEHTGTAGLITEGVNGFVYPNDDARELRKQIEQVIEQPEQLQRMAKDCRELYEQYFSEQAFEAKLKGYLQQLPE